ncbi:MAG: 50S ribosome-binding GTPase, partial [Hyphomicrobiales bacterium]|nr:50S ribosome-binding GTPase [Hyphomicrobiales bacterium]
MAGERGVSAAGQEAARRCGFVALIGAPNAGKSTLLNALVGQKVSIVSRKAQTTRALVRAIAIEGEAQIIFVDTPGIFMPKRRLDRAMVTSAWSGAGDADLVSLLVDARKGVDDEVASILDRLAEEPRRKLLILNKTDVLADKAALIP